MRRGFIGNDYDIMRCRNNAGHESMEQTFFHHSVYSFCAVYDCAFRRPRDLRRSEHGVGRKSHRLLSISAAVDTDADVHGLSFADLRRKLAQKFFIPSRRRTMDHIFHLAGNRAAHDVFLLRHAR